MSKVETLKHSCVICQGHEYLLETKPRTSPESNAEWVESIKCTMCGYPISALEYFESQSGLTLDDLNNRTIN